ncbi:E22 family MetX-like putative esterase [Paraglaciecola polaris]|uniref:Probable acyltransferase n=1 Tax=Paraglaciecola polaris LMG 21857 TaxID=1129793 RepID=K6Z9C2_9ALTE|nr:homoserine O-acetyltransferase [Paraglaciecola polaris]GAC32746.1 homoserine O-acetyltransferase [Paraglaciecola polaris LMG 21857]
MQLRRLLTRTSLILLSLLTCYQATATTDLLVEKKRFELDAFTTFGGKTIKQLQVGWESYGKLNNAKDNVILITHYFSASSHAAGKYTPNDTTPGYWDAIIGPGKAIDTNKYFVLSVDTLANLNAFDPNVITTGPASINPDTGKAYGLTFPVVTIRDFVNVQKALLANLGITKLHAVIGASMGSMQALDWATAYPDWVPRMISVIGSGQSDAWTTALLEQWAIPIRLDKNWANGDYYDGERPLQGLTAALMFITQDALTPAFFNTTGESMQYSAMEEGPLNDINKSHSIVTWLHDRAENRSKLMDANHLLYLVRASQLYMAGHSDNLREALAQVKAKTLFLPSSNDLLLMPYLAKDSSDTLQALGNNTHYQELSGNLGHLNGVLGISQSAKQISSFLQE